MTTQPTEEQTMLIDRLVALDLELKELKEKAHMLEVDNNSLRKSCAAMGRDISITRRQKSQYFRCLKWMLGHTNIDPKTIPSSVYHTLVHVAGVVAAKAEKQE